MIIAVDVYYSEQSAKAVSIEFTDWRDEEPVRTHTEYVQGIQAYTPGQFYKRELPCILAVLEKSDLSIVEAIIVDGYVILNDEGKIGLGGYLYEALAEEIPVIGVAKRSFHQNSKNVIEVLRGKSERPLYVSSSGIPLTTAAKFIKNMAGTYRMPKLLSTLDRMTKES